MKISRQELIELFKDLRVADVRDGMDWMGYHGYGSMDPKIRPIYRTHAVGLARTARYLPFEGPVPGLKGDEYSEWSDWYYKNVAVYPWIDDIEQGDFIALDVSGVDVGLIGSANGLECKIRGAQGFVTNGGGIRDTDECILEQIPVWSYFVSQKMDQCRIRYIEKDIPVSIGGVAIYPGDVIVADGDGVIVVPQAVACDVAVYAHRELRNDKKGRREMYDRLGWEHDSSVSED